MSAVISRGAGLPGNQRGGDDDVHVLRLLGEGRELGLLEALTHHLGVTADTGAFLLVIDGNELGAHRLHLFGDFRARVVGAHDGAEADCGTQRGETGDAGADDEDLGGRHLAGGRDLAGEEAAEVVSRLDDRAVAGDVGHGGQRIQLLGARDPRHAVHGEHREPCARRAAA